MNLDNQAAFDKAVRHLRRQRAHSLIDPKAPIELGRGCAYRSPDGLQCAVGCLIPDAEYETCLEGWSCERVYRRVATLGRLSLPLLEALQCVHDDFPVSRWEERFEHVANTFGLTMPSTEEP